MMPVMIDDILEAMAILTAASGLFASRCLADIRADAARCRFYFERSPALATALNPLIGYAAAAELAKEAARGGRTIVELVREKGILPPSEARALFDPGRLTRPGVPAVRGRRARVRPRKGGGA